MIGRAARGNPWIFRQVSEYMNNGTIIAPPSVEEICQMIKRHAKGLCEIKGEFTGIRAPARAKTQRVLSLWGFAAFRRLSPRTKYRRLLTVFN